MFSKLHYLYIVKAAHLPYLEFMLRLVGISNSWLTVENMSRVSGPSSYCGQTAMNEFECATNKSRPVNLITVYAVLV